MYMTMYVFVCTLCRTDVTAFDNFHWTALHHASHAGEVRGIAVRICRSDDRGHIFEWSVIPTVAL